MNGFFVCCRPAADPSGSLYSSSIGKKPPSEYIGKFEKQNKSLRETLQTHLIKDLDTYGINTNDYDCFINHRAKAIASALNAKLMSMTPVEAEAAESGA